MGKEIERRFLVKGFPVNLEHCPSVEIAQGYLMIEGEKHLRIRSEDEEKFIMTFKKGRGRERNEKNIPITKEEFEEDWPETEGRIVKKTRYFVRHKKWTIELNIFHEKLEGYVHAEVESKSAAKSAAFIPPDWLGEEVTNDPRHENISLATCGIPEKKKDCPIIPVSANVAAECMGIPRYPVKEGVSVAVEMIREKIKKTSDSILVMIAGGSASGKTDKVTNDIRKSLGDDAMIISLDDYYKGLDFMKTRPDLNWDHPEAVELDLAEKHLVQMKSGQKIMKPIYQIDPGIRKGYEEVLPRRIILVEGNLALSDGLAKLADLKIFVDVGVHGRLIRRLLRDVHRTSWKPADILRYFSEIVQPMHEAHIEKSKKNADIIILNEYNPEVEAEKSGLHEIQLKYSPMPDPEQLRKIGAERLGSVAQEDFYYSPFDRDLSATGEMVRIRKDNGNYLLTYKGPKDPSDFCERSKFEFEIDRETADKFVSMYGREVKRIKKDRALYHCNRTIITLDSNIVKIENGTESKIEDHMEIRCLKHLNEDCEDVRHVVEDFLGLRLEDGIKKSYAEM